MTRNHKNDPKNIWDRIKNTDTFQSLKDNTEKVKENFKENKEKNKASSPKDDFADIEKDEKITGKDNHSYLSIAGREKEKASEAFRSKKNSGPERTDQETSLTPALPSRTDRYNTNLPSRSNALRESSESSQRDSILVKIDTVYMYLKRGLLILILLALLFLFIGGGLGYGYFVSLLDENYKLNQDELMSEVFSVTSSSSMYYADGTKIADLRTDLRRIPIELEDIPANFIAAVIATEDNYFYEHNGVVPKAIFRAVYEQVSNTGSTGGSTITQQLVKQQLLTDETTFERKANEMALAMTLEESASKEDILESYLNVSPFGRNNRGQNIAGIHEAAMGIFGVQPEDLSLAQAAYLAGLPKSPIEYSPYDQNGDLKEDNSQGLQRQADVLFFMLREGYIEEDQYQEAVSYDMSQDFLQPQPSEETKLSYVYDEVERRGRDLLIEQLIEKDEQNLEEVQADEELFNQYYEQADSQLRNGGYKIHSTIDKATQDALQQTISENAWFIGSARNVYWQNEETGETDHMVEEGQNGSILIDNETGRVIAFVGGIDYDKNNFNNATQMRRSPASALKPLSVYGPALELGIITPASVVYDGPIRIDIPGVAMPYEPKNATGFSNRWWNAREALEISQNIPAVRIYSEMYAEHDIMPFFRNSGIGPDAIPDQDFTNLSLALGGVTHGTTVEELSGAYAAIANDGVYNETHVISHIEDAQGEIVYQASDDIASTQVYSEETAYLLQDILRGVSTDGTGQASRSNLNFSLDLMSKTGTSDDTRDIWYVGSTPKITFGSWIGYRNIMDTNLLYPEFGHSSSNRNQMIWARMLNAVYAVNPEVIGVDETFNQPESIVTTDVLSSTGMKPATVTSPSGRTYTASGDMKSEIFHPDFVPGETTYDFAINGTERELRRFWSSASSDNPESFIDRFFNRGNSDQNNSEEEPDDEEETSQDEDTNPVEDFIDGFRQQFE